MNNPVTTGWRRILELQKRIQAMDLSGALIHKGENIYYYSGVFPNEPSFILVPAEGEPELIVAKASYQEATLDSLLPVVAGELDIAHTARERLLALGCLRAEGETAGARALSYMLSKPIGVEFDYLPLGLLGDLHIKKYRDISPIIWDMRFVKDGGEIEYLKEACRIADAAMAEVAPLIKPGMTEREVSGLIDQMVKAKGADESKARVRSGPNSAKAFTKWMGGQIVEGPLLIDYGARVKGYWSDITRTFYVGKKPTPEFAEIYSLVLDSQRRGLEEMKRDNSIYQVEIKVRQVLAEKNYDQQMIFTAGHAIGLEVHEPPVLSMPPQAVEKEMKLPGWFEGGKGFQALLKQLGDGEGPRFKAGSTFALEPGVYLPQLGIRIEDMILVGEEESQYLSSFPRELEDIILF